MSALSALAVLSAACGFHGALDKPNRPPPGRESAPAGPSSVVPGSDVTSIAPESAATAILEAPLPPHFTLDDESGRTIEVYSPSDTPKKAPLVVFLHATCMEPAWVCDWFGSAGTDAGWLVCPSGNGTCNGEPDWEGAPKEKASFLKRDIDRVNERIHADDGRGGVLIGWSRGAFAARDILYASTSTPELATLATRFTGLVLMAAKVQPDIATLRAAGIRRVVMAAGDYDLSSSSMSESVRTLKSAGVEARFISLGKIAHVWPKDFEARMREPIAWAAGRSEADAPAK